MTTVKIGIIGIGFIGPAHIEAVRRLGFVEVIAIAGTSIEKAKKKAEELSIPFFYGDYREMLQNPDIQVVHNCTPNNVHFQINKDIIAAGKHVLSEKPLALDSKETAELVQLANESGIVHGVNFNYRQFPILNQLSSQIERGDYGKVNLIHGSYLQDWLQYETDYSWRLDSAIGGKTRAIADIGSHWCDTVQYATGKTISEVLADLTTVYPTRKKSQGTTETFASSDNEEEYEEISIDTEDFASVLIRFTDGSKGVFTVSQVSAGRKNMLSFEVNGSKQSAFWNQEEPEKLWIGHRDRANEVLLADPELFTKEARSSIHHPGGHNEGWPDSVKNMMLNFYSFIRDEKDLKHDIPGFATFEDGHRSMCIVDAIWDSHLKEGWVKVKR